MTSRDRTGRIFTPRLIPALLTLAALAALSVFTGCSSGSTDPWKLLRQAEEKALEVSQSTTSLRMRESLSMLISSPVGDLEQRVELMGAIEMPLKERYEYLESWSGDLVASEKPPVTTMSYVTLDGGKTVYVRSSLLEQRVGVTGWVYYAPAAGENRYFDYLRTVRAVTGYAEEVTLAGEEDVNGIACWHLEITPSLQALVREQMESNPAFAEEYGDSEIGQNIREVKADIWISREGSFPVRVYNMMVMENVDVGEEVTVRMQVDFEGYGEKLLLPVDAPAVYTKAE